jgi:hypothetical protein
MDEKKVKIPIYIHQRMESKSAPKSLNWKWNKIHQKNIDPILPDWEVNTSHYDVVFNNRSICQVVLEKLTFITGEEIFGLFDFNKSELHCIKVSIPTFFNSNKVECDLVSEEIVRKEYLLSTLDDTLKYTNYSHFEENTTNSLVTNFQLMILHHFPANIATDLLNIKWILKFKFYFVEKKFNLLTIEHLENLSSSIKSIKMELPIHIYPKDSMIQIKEF